MYETSCQSRFDARNWMLGAGALGRPRGMVRGGRREEGSGWGTCVYLWRIHVDIWQNQYNIVKLKNKIIQKKTLHVFHPTELVIRLTSYLLKDRDVEQKEQQDQPLVLAFQLSGCVLFGDFLRVSVLPSENKGAG